MHFSNRLLLHAPWLTEALLIPGLLAIAAFAAGKVSRSGALGGWVLAAALYWLWGWRGMVEPLTFFLLAVTATGFGYQQKAAAGIAQEAGGRRSAKHALANVSAGLLIACLWYWRVCDPRSLLFAYAASYATAAADTVSSEIGQVLGKTPINPVTFKRVPPGTEGAVSIEGTVAGLLGAAIVGLFSGLIGVGAGDNLIATVGIVTLAGGVANWLESLAGAVGGPKLNNEVANFANTIAGGIVGFCLALAWRKWGGG